MKLKLYLDNGYVDIESIMKFADKNDCPFIFITGGRGTGKTFSMLKYLIEQEQLFIYLRRKQTQVDIINKQEFSPFNPIAKHLKKEIVTEPITKFNTGFYFGEWDSEKEKYIPTGKPLAISTGLTTISNLRSIGIAEECKCIVYDEFIPEKHEKAIKNEAMAFLNCIETIGRNREINGDNPLRVVCLANAMDIGNAIFTELKLVDVADTMELKDYDYKVLKDRGILMIRLAHSPISSKKKQTSLYRMTQGTGFYDMSVANYFAFEEKGQIKNYPINEFVLVCQMDDIFCYRHKSIELYYVSARKSGTPKEIYRNTNIEKARLRSEHPDIGSAYMFNLLYFDRYGTEIKFKEFMGVR